MDLQDCDSPPGQGNNILAQSMAVSHYPPQDEHADPFESCFRIPHDSPPRWLLVLTAYLDESGQEQREGWMVVAGFAGTEEQWRSFAPDWKEAIRPRKHLHLADLRFKNDRDRRMLERAGVLPDKHGLMRLFGAVRLDDYADMVEGTIDEYLYPGYVACCQPLVFQALRGIPKHERLELVVEQQDRYWPIFDQAMGAAVIATTHGHPELCLPSGVSKLANWRWVPKHSTPLTEPADYLAFALLHLYRDPNSRKSKWCKPILGNGEGYGRQVPRESVRRIVAGALALHGARPSPLQEKIELLRKIKAEAGED